MTKGECGCTVTILRFDNIEHPIKWRINHCPKHKAVDDLYEALKAIRDEGTRCLDTCQQDNPVRAIYNIDLVDRLARQALAKVEKL